MLPRKILYPTLAGILFLLIISTFYFQQAIRSDKLPILATVQDFALIDTQRKPFTLQKLKGKIWVVDFIFTTCGSLCPVMTKNMAALHRTFLSVDSVEMVSISVNPDQDSPEVLGDFAMKYQADTRKWHFLTGTPEEIGKMVLGSFKLGSIEEPIFHSDQFVLVDRYGRIRGYYGGTETNNINRLFKDISALLKEK